MSTHPEERADHVDVCHAILIAHRHLSGFRHAFVGLAGTIIRLSHIFLETGHLDFPERDEFLKRRWLRSNQHLLVHVERAHFAAACVAVGASPIHRIASSHPVATFTVGIQSTHDGGDVAFDFDLVERVDPRIQPDHEWPRDECILYADTHQAQAFKVPAERAVHAAVRRLRPLYDCPLHEIAGGFNEHNPPPVPLELLAFNIEWRVQLALDNLGRSASESGFLSPSAWKRDVSRIMTAKEYQERAVRLGKVLESSLQTTPDSEEPMNLLTSRAAREEDAETGVVGRTSSVRLRRLRQLVEDWHKVLEIVQKRFELPYPSAHTPVRRD